MVGAALELLDEEGLEGLTMRTLAERLGVRAASLYWYIRDKDQLLALLAEAILAEVPEPAPDRPWRVQLETFAADYRRVLHSHRDAARIVMQVQPATPRLYERLVRPLLDAGFDGRAALDACQLLAATYVPATVAGEWGMEAGAAAEPGDLRAPLGTAAQGRLELPGGVVTTTLRGSTGSGELFVGRYQGKQPTVEVRGGTVRITKRFRALQFRPEPAEVELNAGIPWNIDVAGGAWKLDADLRKLRLVAMTFHGDVSSMTLLLPPPAGTVPLRFAGAAHKATITRPPGVAARIRVKPGASKLTLDTLRVGAAGETDWETPDFAAATDRYDVEIARGAHELTFTAAGDDAEEPPPGATPAPSRSGAVLESLSAEEYPTLAALAAEMAETDPDARFEFGLQLLLDGMERRLR
jgi:TetR/AcrR family tetracycline transcriptional repressor